MNRLLPLLATPLLAAGLLTFSLLSACTSQAPKASVTGEVFYLQRMALPPQAVLSVTLQDVSLADAPSIELARQQGPVSGQVPLPFKLDYNPQQVDPRHRYSVSARIEQEGRLLFISTQHYSVKLDGSDQPLRIKLDPIR